MHSDEMSTKSLLIDAAGELFAEYGLEGTTVRAIADKAGVNIAAINYHFGSKENLYREVLMFVAKRGETYPALQIIQTPSALRTRQGQIEAIKKIIHEKFRVIFAKDNPKWYWRLMVRSMLDVHNPAVEAVVHSVFEPEHNAIKTIVQAIKPGVDEDEAHLWGFLMFGAISFYVFAKTPILLLLDREEYSDEFIHLAANFVAEAMIAAFKLT